MNLTDEAGRSQGNLTNPLVVSLATPLVVTPAATPAVTQVQQAPYQGVVPLTVGTAATAGRGFMFNIGLGGIVTITMADGSVVPLNVPAGMNGPFPFAVSKVNSGPTGSYYNLV